MTRRSLALFRSSPKQARGRAEPQLGRDNTADGRKAGSGSRMRKWQGLPRANARSERKFEFDSSYNRGDTEDHGASGSRRGATNGSKTSVSQNGSKTSASAKRPSQQQTSRSGGSGGVTKSQPRSRTSDRGRVDSPWNGSK